MKRDLKEQVDCLLNPSSVAVVGVSSDPRRISGRPMAYFKKYGYQGRLYGINPKYATVQGQPCFAQPADLPEPVDLAVFSLPAELIADSFEQMCRRGMKAAVIFSGGFAEMGSEGKVRQDRLAALAREYGVALDGPNCLGVISFVHGTYATFGRSIMDLPPFPPGDVALLSQSGGMAINVYAEGVVAGARFSHLISSGNEAGLEFSDYLEYLAEDPHTRTVIGYLEGVRDGERFCRALARLQAAGKQFLVMKVGRSADGTGTIRSHTGMMSGDDSGFEAAFARYGVIRLDTIEDLIDHSRVYSLPPVSGGVSAATVTGGAAVYVSDVCSALGVPLTPFQPETFARLREVVPRYGIFRNPVDITAQMIGDNDSLRRILQILAGDPGTGLVLMFMGGYDIHAGAALSAMAEIQKELPKPFAVVWSGAPEEVRLQGTAAGLTMFSDPIRLLRPMSHRLSKNGTPSTPVLSAPPVILSGAKDLLVADGVLPSGTSGSEGSPPSPGRAPVSEGMVPSSTLTPAHLREAAPGRLVLDEWAAMALVEQAGIATPRRWRVRDAQEVERVAAEVRYPCVVKLLDPVVAHRAQVGAVLTDLRSSEELRDAWRRLARDHAARVALVAEQVGPGLEMLIGAVRDPVFGQRVVVGAGGVWTNELNDTVTLIPPLDAAYVRERLRTLRIWPMLRGGPRRPGYAVDSLV